MTFSEWRTANKISISRIALTIGEPETIVQRWCYGEKIPKTLHKLFERRFGLDCQRLNYEAQGD